MSDCASQVEEFSGCLPTICCLRHGSDLSISIKVAEAVADASVCPVLPLLVLLLLLLCFGTSILLLLLL